MLGSPCVSARVNQRTGAHRVRPISAARVSTSCIKLVAGLDLPAALGAAVDLDRLAQINSRLARARESYREALLAEHQAVAQRKPMHTAREGVRLAAVEYESALDEFIKFTVIRQSA